jgi:hypothetical protein
MWVAEIAVPGIIMRQKGTPDPGRILKSKKCCDAQQLPDGFEICAAKQGFVT